MPNYNNPNRSQHFNGPLYDRMTEDLHLTGQQSVVWESLVKNAAKASGAGGLR